MKVFVYDKKNSKKIAIIEKVANVLENKVVHQIYITTENAELFTFDTRFFKTTAYQN